MQFTFGGTLSDPKVSRLISAQCVAHGSKWTRFPLSEYPHSSHGPILSDFFSIRRGLATGDNSYFILTAKQIAERNLAPGVFYTHSCQAHAICR